MPTDRRAELAAIKRFDQLVRFLRDEMGWPIDSDDFEELTFEYTPEELGIDAKNAAKIQEIKRLRPLAPSQPWGIFFVKFEPKKLPVVALRRILSQVALKKRTSVNKAERRAWAADDLLFVSNYGGGAERQISFAHFATAPDGHDLPTLKVLGWDNLDTALHLDSVARELTEKLAWPDDEADAEAWRERWRAAFTLRLGQVVNTSRELSIRLAELARAIRDRIKTALAIETDKGPLTRLMKAFQEALVHDLDANGFADMYAQTIAYGLLSARIADPHRKTADDFAAHMRTNPFLRELMETFLKVGGRHGKAGGPGIDFDELGVSEVVELLDDADMEAVVLDFGDRNPQEDPVIHFYELFLKEYDARKRMQRGVFYTPRPVVSYIVRSVDELVRTEFGLADGLADTTTWGEMAKLHKNLKIPEGVSPDQAFVQILDLATGTGTFLVELIDLIHHTLLAKWKAEGQGQKEVEELWNDYVPKHLLPRLHGYELLMAPYAIAHLKIGLKLYETGYHFDSDERARIYLTNALDPAHDFSGRFAFAIPALAHEGHAVNEIKRKQRFTVVVGNPPYSNFGQLNRIPFILSLLEDYKRGLDEKKLNLDDDYIKFARFAHWLIEATGAGIVGMITNNSYLDGLSHRRMREALRQSFGKLSVLDLCGSVMRGDVGGGDENVFDIQQGVAIGIFQKSLAVTSELGSIESGQLKGTRENKYRALASRKAALSPIGSTAPYHFFVSKQYNQQDPYLTFSSIREIFEVFGPGIKAERDAIAIHCNRHALEEVVRDFQQLDVSEIRTKYGLCKDSRDWTVAKAKADTIANARAAVVTRIQYRPFDYRWTWYSGQTRGFIGTPGSRIARQMLGWKNMGLVTNRQIVGEEFSHVLVSSLPTSHGTFYLGNKGQDYLAPLYLRALDEDSQASLVSAPGARHNFSDEFLERISSTLRLKRPRGSLPEGMTPEDVFHYIYAVLHSPGYRSRYAEFLKIDFPRLPLTSEVDLFWALARLGGELVGLHLLESNRLVQPITEFIGNRNSEVVRVGWSDDTVWLDAGARKKGQPATPGTIGFRGVTEAVWNLRIGGYRVCEKWLKDRKGRALSRDDIAHYQKIVSALSETIRLMSEIEEVVELHGGWPGAFQCQSTTERTSDRLSLIAKPGAEYRSGTGTREQ